MDDGGRAAARERLWSPEDAPGDDDAGEPVFLQVYDLVEANAYSHWAGVGIYHSGVEVYGVEYAYGGHEYDAPGIFATRPREAPGTLRWRERVPAGRTRLSRAEVHAVIAEMGRGDYRGNRYHLLQRNCNNFSADAVRALTGAPAPAWINRAASWATSLHCLLPPGWLPPLQPPTADAEGLAAAAVPPPAPAAGGERARLVR